MRPVLPSKPLPRRAAALLSAAVLATVLVGCAGPTATPTAAPEWRLDSERSRLNFVTTKSGAAGVGGIAETMRFTRFAGGVGRDGKITLDIELASIDSGVGVRDDRMRTLLWNVSAAPRAAFTAQLGSEAARQLGAAAQTLEVDGQLSMAGQAKPVKAQLRVVALPGGRLQVSTAQPIMVNAADYGLRGGVEALREVMGLNFIGTSVPVSFTLELSAG